MDMTSGLQGTLYLTNVEDSVVVLKVCHHHHQHNHHHHYQHRNPHQPFNRRGVLKVWLEECNYREYPALTVVEVRFLHLALQIVFRKGSFTNIPGVKTSTWCPDASWRNCSGWKCGYNVLHYRTGAPATVLVWLVWSRLLLGLLNGIISIGKL